MKQNIRWSGLAAFALILGVLVAVSLIFLDTWIKLGAEKGLGQAVGAEVNIGRVTHTLSPFSVTFNSVQMTDATTPSNNKVQAQSVAADVELIPLLMHKVMINHLQITGIEFDQKRANPGKVYREPDEQQSFITGLDGEEIELPDIDELLANSPLKTTQAAMEAEEAYAKHRQKLEEQYQSLPNKEKLEHYKQQIEALKDTDYNNPAELLAAKEKFDGIKAEMRADKQKFTDFRNSVTAARNELTPKVAALKAAPGEDYQRLKGVAVGDSAAISDVTAMVFGEQARVWSERLLAAVEVVGPMLQNNKEKVEEETIGKGRWYEFTDATPLPDLLIRKASIGISWQQNSIDSQWQNITDDHTKLGKPTTFSVDAEKTELWQTLIVNGNLWVDDIGLKANQTWKLAGLSLQPSNMVKEDKFSVALTQARLNSIGSLSVEQSAINGNGNIDFSALKLNAKGSNKLTNVIASSLNELTDLSIDTTISGNIKAPSFSFKSDLDKKLVNALSQNISGEAQAKLAELENKLNEQATSATGKTDKNITQLLNWDELADGNLQNLDGLLKSKFDSLVDRKKDDLKEKLLKKLKF